MSTEINEKLDEILARAAAATLGPWEIVSSGRSGCGNSAVVHGKHLRIIVDHGEDFGEHLPDAAFIAAARTDVPALVKALRRAMSHCHCSEESKQFIATILNAAPPQTTGAVPAEEDVTP